jgi:hypothetical protein
MESEWIEWETTHFVYIYVYIFLKLLRLPKPQSLPLPIKVSSNSYAIFFNQFVIIEKLPLSLQIYSSLFCDVDFVTKVLFTTKEGLSLEARDLGCHYNNWNIEHYL